MSSTPVNWQQTYYTICERDFAATLFRLSPEHKTSKFIKTLDIQTQAAEVVSAIDGARQDFTAIINKISKSQQMMRTAQIIGLVVAGAIAIGVIALSSKVLVISAVVGSLALLNVGLYILRDISRKNLSKFKDTENTLQRWKIDVVSPQFQEFAKQHNVKKALCLRDLGKWLEAFSTSYAQEKLQEFNQLYQQHSQLVKDRAQLYKDNKAGTQEYTDICLKIDEVAKKLKETGEPLDLLEHAMAHATAVYPQAVPPPIPASAEEVKIQGLFDEQAKLLKNKEDLVAANKQSSQEYQDLLVSLAKIDDELSTLDKNLVEKVRSHTIFQRRLRLLGQHRQLTTTDGLLENPQSFDNYFSVNISMQQSQVTQSQQSAKMWKVALVVGAVVAGLGLLGIGLGVGVGGYFAAASIASVGFFSLAGANLLDKSTNARFAQGLIAKMQKQKEILNSQDFKFWVNQHKLEKKGSPIEEWLETYVSEQYSKSVI